MPTIRTFPATTAAKRKQTPGTYEGQREAIPIAQHAATLIPTTWVNTVSDATSEGFFNKRPKWAHALLFTAKTVTTTMFKALSVEYRKTIVFGEVRASKLSKRLVTSYGVTKYPTLVMVKPDGKHEKHTGGLSHMSLSFFLDKFVDHAKRSKEEL